MFNKNIKYTMEEFKEMFDTAKKKFIEEDSADIKDKIDDPVAGFMATMMGVSAVTKLETMLFGENKKEEK